jgi:hypothetical protein
MNKEEAKKVKLGDNLFLTNINNTPGRNYGPGVPIAPVNILGILTENGGYRHFDIGLKLPNGESPLKSRDTDEEIDGSDIYWLHPSRFELSLPGEKP